MASSEKAKVNFSDDVVSTSTTKALLISIAVPRVYRIYLPPKAVEDETAISTTTEDLTSSGSTIQTNAEETKEKVVIVEIPSERNDIGKSAEEPSMEEAKEEDGITEVGYVEEHDDTTKDPVVEHVLTQEEMATVVKIDPNAKGDDTTNENENAENAEREQVETTNNEPIQSITASMVSEAMKLFYGVTKKGTPLTKEEAVAVMKAYEPQPKDDSVEFMAPNTEIKVEALLRLTFRNMYSEGHFYNAPIYTDVQSPLKDGEDAADWVELAVMVKDSSIGIILERLERIGVGSTVGTISIYKAELCRTADFVPKTLSKLESNGEESTASKEDVDNKTASIEAARAEWKNAASRLRVEQVKEQIHEQATLSLDFLALLTIASILAGIGLITDSTVVIVASMLVSPIMGPVMGMTFGSRVLDWNLAKYSTFAETVALLLAVLIGAIIGFATSWTEIAEDWPSNEMSSRGDTVGLLTGIAIAIPSGMGVALSILGNNTASLVGVAISASLLPPAVNAGICWAHAILIRTGSVDNPSHADFAKIGAISFALTVVNIFCIWIFGMLMFAIKEVAPAKSKSAFWARDIKVARAIKKGSKEVDLDVIKAGLQDALEKERKAETPQQPRRMMMMMRKRQRQNSTNFSFNLAENPVDDTAPMEEIMGPTPLTGDAQYIGLEDIGELLGFDEVKSC